MKEINEFLNKIICGDCLEVMKEISDKSINLTITDIPYEEVNRKDNGLRNLNKKKGNYTLITSNF